MLKFEFESSNKEDIESVSETFMILLSRLYNNEEEIEGKLVEDCSDNKYTIYINDPNLEKRFTILLTLPTALLLSLQSRPFSINEEGEIKKYSPALNLLYLILSKLKD